MYCLMISFNSLAESIFGLNVLYYVCAMYMCAGNVSEDLHLRGLKYYTFVKMFALFHNKMTWDKLYGQMNGGGEKEE